MHYHNLKIVCFVAVIHYFLSPLLMVHGFIPVLLSNLLFMAAASYYHYLNFLGYDGKLILLVCCFALLLNVGQKIFRIEVWQSILVPSLCLIDALFLKIFL